MHGLPCSVLFSNFGILLEKKLISLWRLVVVVGEATPVSSMRQTLTCLVPAVIRLVPSHAMVDTVLVHLLVECKVADPVLELMFQMYNVPSFVAPRLARYCESGLNAMQRTPKV
jgi:hypothetical protein